MTGTSFDGPGGSSYENPELARQFALGNGEVGSYVQAIAEADPERWDGASMMPRPYPELLGTPEWYDARVADHLRRHHGDPAPPDYYLDYGKKYCLRFSEDLYPQLSDEGKAWLIKTRTELQRLIEEKLINEPREFVRLESDSEAFRDFAFKTHKGAYLNGGLATLPMVDLVAIGQTPDLADLLSEAGLSQVISTGLPVAEVEAGEFFTEGHALVDQEHGLAWLQGEQSGTDPIPGQAVPETTDLWVPQLMGPADGFDPDAVGGRSAPVWTEGTSDAPELRGKVMRVGAEPVLPESFGEAP